jgi:hypothetical protein
MQPAAVHEHGGEDGVRIARRVLAEPDRDEGPLPDERVAAVQFHQEEQNVQDDQPDRDDGQGPARRVVVAKWKDHCVRPLRPLSGILSCANASRIRKSRYQRFSRLFRCMPSLPRLALVPPLR